MGDKRIVYVHPGELVEFRFVHPSSDKSAAGWRDQLRPPSLLLQLNDDVSITAANPRVSLDLWRFTPTPSDRREGL